MENYKAFIARFGFDLFIQMFQSLSMIAYHNGNKILPCTVDDFHFTHLAFAKGTHIQRPHEAKGHFTKGSVYFEFHIKKSVGMREIISFTIKEAPQANKTCICSKELVWKDGCHCGAIKRYSPVY